MQLKRIDFGENLISIKYIDENDPKWVKDRVLTVNWRENSHLRRLGHVGCHMFLLLIQNPECVETHDEVLQEWIGKLFHEQLEEEHETP